MSEHNGHMPFEVGLRNLASRHVDDRLAAYTGGECSELERVAIERHLDACAACRAALDETLRIRALLAPLATQSTPMSVADSVLARLATSTGEGSAGPHIAESATAEVIPQHTDCPVSPTGDVSLPVARPEASSSWRRREGAPERDTTAMERHTSTSTQTPAQRGHAWRNRITCGAPESGGRLRSFATVAAVVLIALGAGIFGLMSHRTTLGPGGQPLATVTALAQNVSADLPANSTLADISMDSPTDGWAVGTVNNAPNGGGGSKNERGGQRHCVRPWRAQRGASHGFRALVHSGRGCRAAGHQRVRSGHSGCQRPLYLGLSGTRPGHGAHLFGFTWQRHQQSHHGPASGRDH